MLVHPDIELARAVLRDLTRGHPVHPAASRQGRWWQFWQRGGTAQAPPRSALPIEVRLVTASDRSAIERLAALDEKPAPTGDQVLVAEVGGRLWAALDLAGSGCVADPFVPSADAVELLRVRAAQLRGASASRGRPRTERRQSRASATVGA